MFDTYVLDRRVRSSRAGWFATALIIAATIVGAAIAAFVIHAWWQINRLTPRYQPVSFAAVAPPPEAPAAEVAPPPIDVDGPKDPDPDPDKTVIVPTEPVQPVDKDKPDETRKDPAADPNGANNGVAGGQKGGTGIDPNGVLGGDKNAPPGGTGKPGTPIVTDVVDTETKTPPTKIPLSAIAGQRTAGRERIPLPHDVKVRAVQDKKLEFDVGAQLCLDATGAPERVEVIVKSGYPEADAAVVAEMRNWRFNPYKVNDKPVRVCTVYVMHYVIAD